MATKGAMLWSKTAATNATADSTVNWAEGMAPSAVNDSSRAEMASVAIWRDDISGTLTAGGTSTAYTLTTNATFATAAAMSGALITFIVGTTNGADVTLAVDGLTARQIVTATGSNVGAGSLVAGCIYSVTYVHASTEFRLHNFVPLFITSLTAETAVAQADVFPFYDDSAAANRKVTLPNLFKGFSVLDAETAIATDDLVLISDTSDSANANKMTVVNLFKVVDAFTEDTSPDEAADFILTYDTSATTVKKVKPENLDVSDLVFISTTAASSSTEIDLTTGFDDTYDSFEVRLSNVKMSSDGATLYMRIGTGGGPTFQAGVSDYEWGSGRPRNSAFDQTGSSGLSRIEVSGAIGNATGENLSGVISFNNPEVTDFCNFHWTTVFNQTSGDVMGHVGVGRYTTAAAITGLRFLPSAGNIVSGRFSLYGYKKA